VKKIPKALFLLIGTGIIENDLKTLVKELNVERNIVFLGWIPFEEALQYVQESDICVIPYAKTLQTDASFPHKLTQYMYLSKPIITSDVHSLTRILRETKGGVTFHAGDHEDLAERIEYLYQEKEIRDELGKNGRRAVEKKYNWNIEGKKLIHLYSYLEIR